MKNIILIIKKWFTNINYTIFLKNSLNKPVLGRWTIESCNKKVNYKVDLANEDHCGPCGTYVKKKLYDNIRT